MYSAANGMGKKTTLDYMNIIYPFRLTTEPTSQDQTRCRAKYGTVFEAAEQCLSEEGNRDMNKCMPIQETHFDSKVLIGKTTGTPSHRLHNPTLQETLPTVILPKPHHFHSRHPDRLFEPFPLSAPTLCPALSAPTSS